MKKDHSIFWRGVCDLDPDYERELYARYLLLPFYFIIALKYLVQLFEILIWGHISKMLLDLERVP